MRYCLILNFFAALTTFVIAWSGDNQPWLLFICVAFAVFCNVKTIGFIKKYWSSENYFGKAVLGALILLMEDFYYLIPLM